MCCTSLMKLCCLQALVPSVTSLMKLCCLQALVPSVVHTSLSLQPAMRFCLTTSCLLCLHTASRSPTSTAINVSYILSRFVFVVCCQLLSFNAYINYCWLNIKKVSQSVKSLHVSALNT